MQMIKDKLSIFIFSFNRGAFLKNAVESCLENASGARVYVVDDNSSDAETQAYLQQLPAGVELMQPQKQSSGRHGGLYNNMQWALDVATSEWVLFVQDDMQLVRPVLQDDVKYIGAYFEQFIDKAFLNPVFLKGQRSKRDQRITRVYDDFNGYYRHYPQKSNPRGISYADVVIGHVERLRAANWQFEQTEQSIAAQADKLFGHMGFMAHPFVMFLPQVPVYRGKHKTSAVALAEKLSGQQPKYFVTQDEVHWQQFKTRNLTDLPVAERYLECSDSSVKKPYQYSCVNAFWYLRVWHKISIWFSTKV